MNIYINFFRSCHHLYLILYTKNSIFSFKKENNSIFIQTSTTTIWTFFSFFHSLLFSPRFFYFPLHYFFFMVWPTVPNPHRHPLDLYRLSWLSRRNWGGPRCHVVAPPPVRMVNVTHGLQPLRDRWLWHMPRHHHVSSTSAEPPFKIVGWSIINGFDILIVKNTRF